MRLPDLSRLSLVGGASERPPSPAPREVHDDSAEEPERAIQLAAQLYELVPRVERTGGFVTSVVEAEKELYAALTADARRRGNKTTQKELVANLIDKMLVERSGEYMQRVKAASPPAAVEDLRGLLRNYLSQAVVTHKRNMVRGVHHVWTSLSIVYNTILTDTKGNANVLEPSGDGTLMLTPFHWDYNPSDDADLPEMKAMLKARREANAEATAEHKAAKKQKKLAASGES
jgi:predicted DNA-binding ribbon-helix-helix protein